jgi:methyl-accepting chemotaxis protein
MSEDTFRWVITGAVGLSAVCFMVIAIVAVVIYGLLSRLQAKAEDLQQRVVPIVDTARRLTTENAPKFSDIATDFRDIARNAKDISGVAKDQAHRFAEVGRDIADRTKAQVARVDAAMDETVGQVQHAGTNLKAAALKPVREASGVLAGVKAAVSTLAQGRRTTIDHITQDEEMFI